MTEEEEDKATWRALASVRHSMKSKNPNRSIQSIWVDISRTEPPELNQIRTPFLAVLKCGGGAPNLMHDR
jgi:hypothetical protein